MSDIFREVEEDVRRERLEKFWKSYGDFVIAFVVLVLAGVAGYELWLRHETGLRAKTSDAYAAAQRISDPRQAIGAFGDLAKTASGGYGLVAKLSEADALFAAGQIPQAIDLYKQIGQQDSGDIGAVARLRAAWALSRASSRSELETLLAPLNTPASAWRHMAREVLAFSDYRAANVKLAANEYRALAEDSDAPDALRSRARAMSDFLTGSAGADVGTVPAPPPAPALPASPAPAAPAK